MELTGRYSDYRFLCPQGASRTLLTNGTEDGGDGERDVEHPTLQTVRSAMRALAFKEGEICGIFELLAAILHAGNVRLDVSRNDDMAERVEVHDPADVARCARLLKVDEVVLAETMFAGRTLERVLRQRDSFIGALYAALFAYMVEKMNDGSGNDKRDESMRAVSVAMLNAPGFESLQWNGFEQMCRNYIDERLQQLFIQCVFKREQAEYEAQDVEWRHVDFADNVSAIDTLSSLLNLNDAETLAVDEGSDMGLLTALNSAIDTSADVNGESPAPVYVGSPRNGRGLNRSFTVNHYAGPAIYRVKGFREKNSEGDTMWRLESLAHSSHSELLKRVIASATSAYGAIKHAEGGTTAGRELRRSIDSLMAFCRGALLRHQLRSLDSVEERREAMLTRAEDDTETLGTNSHNHEGELELTPNVEHSNGHAFHIEVETDFSPYKFEKFAAAYFERQSACRLVSSPHPLVLLHHSTRQDNIAARAVGICVEQLSRGLQLPLQNGTYVGPESKPFAGETVPLMERIRESLEELKSGREAHYSVGNGHGMRSSSSSKADSQSVVTFENGVEADSQANSHVGGEGYTYAAALPTEQRHALKHLERVLRGDASTTLRAVQLIVGHGLVRPALRDEIYCQILHSITKRQAPDAGAWMLLALCASCFACSPKLYPYLMCFLQTRDAPHPLFSQLISKQLRRTIANGTRCQPPSRAELDAIRSSGGVYPLNVRLTDATIVEVKADSGSTVGEIIRELMAKIGIDEENSFGFALCVSSSLHPAESLDPSTHVMDVIFEHEQRERGDRDLVLLSLKKEIFAPLSPEHPNGKATDLIFHQLASGIQSGEYQLERDEEIALYAAQRYFISSEGAATLDVELLEERLTNFMPTIDAERREKCVQLAMNTYRKRFSNQPNGHSIDDVKVEVVEQARRRWAMQFSRCFTAYKHSGRHLAQNELMIAVNSEGVYFVGGDGCELLLRDFHFAEIDSISCNKSSSKFAENTSTITMRTNVGEVWVLQAPRTRALRRLLLCMIKMLSERSHYLLAVADSKAAPSAKLIEYCRGDLLIATRGSCGVGASASERVEVENVRTGMNGMAPVRDLRIIPSAKRPSLDLLSRLLPSRREPPAECIAATGGTVPRNDRPNVPVFSYPTTMVHTLESFASDNFASSTVNAGAITTTHCLEQSIWHHSLIPIERCLLRRLHGKSDAEQCSVLSYTFLMRYMGDLPAHPTDFFVMPTDVIFKAPLKYEVLRDETYCQLMKQLTFNPNPLSEERGWELMWLCAGLFPPSKGLLPEVERFLLTHQQLYPLAGDCAHRLKRTVEADSNRLFPPHQVEVEAIRQRTTQIFHKVFLPDGREECVEVESRTRGSELVATLVAALGIKSPSGLSLFAKAGDRVLSMPDSHYFFDFIHQLPSLVANGGNAGSTPVLVEGAHPLAFSYQIFFMRKLWIDVMAGEDPAADLAFHFNQELPKYLRGYYSLVGGPYRPSSADSSQPDTMVLSKQVAVRLAALVLRAQTPDGQKPPLEHFQQHVLREIVPKDIVRALSNGEWKRLVATEYNRLTVESASDAKIQFLRELAQFPTFGSAFFDVKQTSDPTMAARVVLAISQNGVTLYNHENLQHIVTYPFTSITNWQSGNTYFHFHTDGSPIKGVTRLLFETTLGYKMDDLLTSYIQTMLSECQPCYAGGVKNAHANGNLNGGESNGHRL